MIEWKLVDVFCNTIDANMNENWSVTVIYRVCYQHGAGMNSSSEAAAIICVFFYFHILLLFYYSSNLFAISWHWSMALYHTDLYFPSTQSIDLCFYLFCHSMRNAINEKSTNSVATNLNYISSGNNLLALEVQTKAATSSWLHVAVAAAWELLRPASPRNMSNLKAPMSAKSLHSFYTAVYFLGMDLL